jgi:hypothetical protein
MLKRLIRRLKIERLARKLDPKAFEEGRVFAISLARKRAAMMIALAK